MYAVQSQLPLIPPTRQRVRRVRRPFHPSGEGRGRYRLPHEIRDRLAADLASYRNREAAFALATFIARFWSMPGRVVGGFSLDRRELAGRDDLGLTEDQVRGAIRVLEEVGFLDRDIPPKGSKYKATEDGLHRKPIVYVFGPDYAPLFIKANERAAAARGRRSQDRRGNAPSSAPRLSVGSPGAQLTNSPKYQNQRSGNVYLGELRTGRPIGLPPKAFVPDPKLEAALENLKRAAEKAGRV
jgi:hypothetical protein